MNYSFTQLPDGRVLGKNEHGNKMFFSRSDILNRIRGVGFVFREVSPEEQDVMIQAAKELGYEWNDAESHVISG